MVKRGDEVRLTVDHIRSIGAQTFPDIYNDAGIVTEAPARLDGGDTIDGIVRVDWDIGGEGKLVRTTNLEVTRHAD